MNRPALALLLLAASCTTEVTEVVFRPCDPTLGSSSSDTGSGSSTDAGGSSDSSSAADSSSSSTGDTESCPDLRGGVAHAEGFAVTFCPAELGGLCREVLVVHAATATGTGPLAVQWHGTYEDPDAYMDWDSATDQLETAVVADAGLLVLPYGDANAIARTGGPFPWWVVGEPTDPAMQTSRADDFVLFDDVVRCALEQGLADPDRIVISGMSAGAIMVSHLVDRHDPALDGYTIAAAASHSGGLPPQYQPASPTGGVDMFLSQGGTTDVYPQGCTAGAPGCYSFVQPTEHLATAVVSAGAYAFVCRHPWGHGSYFGYTAAGFLRAARADQQHPWQPYTTTHAGDWSLQWCGEALP